MFRRALIVTAAFIFAAALPAVAAPPAASLAYATFTKGLTPQRDLFTLWRKDGKVYLDLAKDQLDTDFIQTAVPGNGAPADVADQALSARTVVPAAPASR